MSYIKKNLFILDLDQHNSFVWPMWSPLKPSNSQFNMQGPPAVGHARPVSSVGKADPHFVCPSHCLHDSSVLGVFSDGFKQIPQNRKGTLRGVLEQVWMQFYIKSLCCQFFHQNVSCLHKSRSQNNAVLGLTLFEMPCRLSSAKRRETAFIRLCFNIINSEFNWPCCLQVICVSLALFFCCFFTFTTSKHSS